MIEIGRIKKTLILTLVIFSFVFATFVPAVVSKVNVPVKINLIKDKTQINDKISFFKYYKDTIKKFIFNRLNSQGLLNSYINTNCNGIEKSTKILFATKTDIDVDDNQNTGQNGADIRVSFRIQPYFLVEYDIGIGLIFSLSIDRIGQEIKDNDFTISLSIGDNDLKIGYYSPKETGNEIPISTTINFKIYFFLLSRTRGFDLSINPEYNYTNEGKKIALLAEYNAEEIKREYSFEFDPAVSTDLSYSSTREAGVWGYNIKRTTSMESKLTAKFVKIQNDVEKETILTIDSLPKELKFSLGITPLTVGGGELTYESDKMYDIELIIKSSDLGDCLYSIIHNTPRKIYATWSPTLSDGEYHLEIDSDGTDFILKDKMDNPLINLEVSSLKTIDIDAYWNLTNPGDFTVYKDNDINIALKFEIEQWVAQLSAKPDANYVSTSWFINTTGYLTIDTNGESFNTMDLLVKGPIIGLDTIGEGYKAQDFKLAWTLWPPQEFELKVEGWLDFISVDIDIYLIDNWYHLWPW